MDQPAPQPSRIELVAIINSFNRRELLERAIGSLTQALRKATFGSAIIVFDAGSTDGSRQFLNTWCEQNPADNLIVVTASANGSSFADGVNTACSTALARFPDCRWLFLYETDNWLGSIKPLNEAISLLEAEPGLAAAGFTVRRHNGVLCGYGMRFPSSISLALGLNLAARWNLERPNASVWRETNGDSLANMRCHLHESAACSARGLGTKQRIRRRRISVFRQRPGLGLALRQVGLEDGGD